MMISQKLILFFSDMALISFINKSQSASVGFHRVPPQQVSINEAYVFHNQLMIFQNPKLKITGVVFQNKHGNKYYSNYYVDPNHSLASSENQHKFESALRSKAQRLNISSSEQTEIFTIQSHTVLFKQIDQLQIHLIVSDDENFVLMEQVICVMTDALQLITKGPYTGKVIFDQLHNIVLVVDEVIHMGYIVCMDANKVYDRLCMKDSLVSATAKPSTSQPVASNQGAQGGTFSSLFGFAKNTFNKTLNLG